MSHKTFLQAVLKDYKRNPDKALNESNLVATAYFKLVEAAIEQDRWDNIKPDTKVTWRNFKRRQ